MNTNIQDLILSNKNNNMKWKINGALYDNENLIPTSLLEKNVYNWAVNQWEGIIEITTNQSITQKETKIKKYISVSYRDDRAQTIKTALVAIEEGYALITDYRDAAMKKIAEKQNCNLKDLCCFDYMFYGNDLEIYI